MLKEATDASMRVEYYILSATTGLQSLEDVDVRQRLTPKLQQYVASLVSNFNASPASIASSHSVVVYTWIWTIHIAARFSNHWHLAFGMSPYKRTT
jgi:hypothetical protein